MKKQKYFEDIARDTLVHRFAESLEMRNAKGIIFEASFPILRSTTMYEDFSSISPLLAIHRAVAERKSRYPTRYPWSRVELDDMLQGMTVCGRYHENHTQKIGALKLVQHVQATLLAQWQDTGHRLSDRQRRYVTEIPSTESLHLMDADINREYGKPEKVWPTLLAPIMPDLILMIV